MAENKPTNTAVEQSEEVEEGASQGSRTRSPAYPGINLETAIKRARELYSQDKMNPVPVPIAVRRWGFKEKSSGGLITVAALKSFGLLRDTGSGKDRKVALTDEARRIILDTRLDSVDRDDIIREIALNPKIHTRMWNKWGEDLPADDTLRHELIFEFQFNENSVSDFIREYKDTIRFAKVYKSDSISNEAVENDDLQTDSKLSVTDGIRINTASSVKQVQPREGMNTEIFTLDEGEVSLQWPAKMSPESYEDFKAWLDLIARKAKRVSEKSELSQGDHPTI